MITRMKRSTLFALCIVALFAFTFTSCDKGDSELVDVEALADGSIEKLQSRAFGKNHCLELIFPVGITFTDATTAEIASYEDLHETVKAWFEANEIEKSREHLPALIFPIQVVNEEGEILDVASQEDLQELKRECPTTGKCNGKKGRGFSCFSLVYPVTVTIDGADASFADRTALKEAIQAYKDEAGDEYTRPSLVFPVTIQYEDETQAVANTQEELKAFKKACREEG